MKGILLPFFIFVFFYGMAQDRTKTLQGRVSSPDMDVVGVVVQNTASQEAVITDLDGNFSIKVKVGDTLVFSAVHFRRKLLDRKSTRLNSSHVKISYAI